MNWRVVTLIAKAEIVADLKRWLARSSVPVLFATHDRSEAAALGERMLMLHEGQMAKEQLATGN